MEHRKHNVLFVDDDALVLKGIRRTADDVFTNWSYDFAASSQEALEKLHSQSFDAIVTDMLMPGMDGPQLLEIISAEMPGVLRFVLTGNIRDTQVYRVVSVVHQMIPKPSDIEQIYALVERSCRMRDLLSDPQLLDLITGIKSLPSVPALYTRLTQELLSNDPNPQRVGGVIAQDAAMTAKILQLVNSAFFGLAARISSPQRAVSILGLNTIKSLVLGIDVFSGYQGRPGLPISVEALWNHSLMVSNLAYTISRALDLSTTEQEDARVSGILHDIGKLLQLNLPEFFRLAKPETSGLLLPDEEFRLLKTTHAEMGGYLLGIWGLPNAIVEAVTFHHRPDELLIDKPGLVTALHAANGLLNMWRYEKKPNYAAYLQEDYLQRIGVSGSLDEWSGQAKALIQGSSGPE